MMVSLDWPLKDLYVICGESHEEICMNVTALTLSIPFGLLEFLSSMGRISKASQLQAIKSKRLHTLAELSQIFFKGSMTALIVPFLAHCDKINQKPSVSGLFQFVSSSPNLKYQARFRFLLEVVLPCLLKRIGIRLNNKQIAEGASALFFPLAFAFPHSFYRDFYHLKFLNGQFVPEQEMISPADPDISRFMKDENVWTTANLTKYEKKHPTENIKYGLYKEKYSYLTESLEKNDSHQGGDFIQEDALGHVMPFLKKGKILTIDQFSSAVRKSQKHRDQEREKGKVSCSKAKRPKYEIEIQTLAAMILGQNENPTDEEDLGDLHENTLKISKIGKENYRIFFEKKIDAILTGSIRLQPAFVTKSDSVSYHRIENQRKEDIVKEIVQIISEIEFEEMNERKYFEAKAQKSTTKKDVLIEIHTELGETSELKTG